MDIDLLIILLLCAIFTLLIYLVHRQRILVKGVAESQQQMEEMVQKSADDLFNRLEAYLSLRDRLGLRQGLPYTPDWSASPDFLKLIVEYCLENKPRVIMECSSGLTTLMLARCCQINNSGHVTSLENGLQYVKAIEAHLDLYDLEEYASVVHAPLEKQIIMGEEYLWYSLDQLPDKAIDMLVIDGPSGFIQKHSRYPALPLLFTKISKHCVVFLDDAARQDEREIIAFWMAKFPSIEHQFIKTERGCSILKITREE